MRDFSDTHGKGRNTKVAFLEACPGDESASVTLISLKKIIHPPNAVLLKDERMYWIVIVIIYPRMCLGDILGIIRVAKCHGYGGYIRVRKLEGWGKKSGRINSFAKSSIVLGKFDQLI